MKSVHSPLSNTDIHSRRGFGFTQHHFLVSLENVLSVFTKE